MDEFQVGHATARRRVRHVAGELIRRCTEDTGPRLVRDYLTVRRLDRVESCRVGPALRSAGCPGAGNNGAGIGYP